MDDGKQLRGPITALVTPLGRDGRVDVAAFQRHVARGVEHGMAGVLVGGSTGEGPLLTTEMRARLVAAAVEAAAGAPVLACVTGQALDDLFRDADAASGAGAAALLCLPPFYFNLAPEEQVTAYHAVADRAARPVLAYHIPQLTGATLTVAAVAELAGHPDVVGLKDSSGDPARLARFVAATAGHDFGLFQGSGGRVLDALEAGAAGSITAVANVRPADVVALHRAHATGMAEEAALRHARLAAVSAALDAVPGPLVVAVKAALELEGELALRSCLAPLAAADAAAVARLRDELAALA